jgi:hypothetical protein
MPMTEALDDLLFVHASANDANDWIYVTSERSALPSFRVSKARVIFCGHVHVPGALHLRHDRAGAKPADIYGDAGSADPVAALAVCGGVGRPTARWGTGCGLCDLRHGHERDDLSAGGI